MVWGEKDFKALLISSGMEVAKCSKYWVVQLLHANNFSFVSQHKDFIAFFKMTYSGFTESLRF